MSEARESRQRAAAGSLKHPENRLEAGGAAYMPGVCKMSMARMQGADEPANVRDYMETRQKCLRRIMRRK